jgi:maleylpyruvate isomerase
MTTVHRDLALVVDHSARLLATCAVLDDATAPTLCEGWSRGHVMTHVARNAEAIGRLTSWALSGVPQEMYPGGTVARDAEIEAGATRPVDELTDDVRDTTLALAPQLEQLEHASLAVDEVQMRGGYRVAATTLPFIRLREVVYHHVDLDAGFTFADVDPGLLARFIDDAVSRLRMGSHPPAMRITTDEGGTWSVGQPTAQVSGTGAAVLLWLARRRPEGVHSEGDLPTLPRGA